MTLSRRFSFQMPAALLCAAVCGSLLIGQEYRASIAGEVADPTGAAVPDVNVTVTSVERNTVTEVKSNDSGRYIVQFLIPGTYILNAEKAGFKTFVREGIVLSANDRLGMDIKLELGSQADRVTVAGEVSPLQTETATRSATIENQVMDNLAINGRNLFQMQYVQPGVFKASDYWGSMELYAFGNINGVTINGGRVQENETTLDGITNTKGDRGVGIAPPLNATAEVTVQTNSYDARYGRLGGGVTIITTKSGTNTPHGQLFEFMKHPNLRAGDWATNASGSHNSYLRNDTFGFELDGPIFVPKLFDGRNRLFFMVSYEGLREKSEQGQLRTIPTPDLISGDFSHLRNTDGDQVIIYDPLTTHLNPDGTYTRTPFPGNRIPADRINPIAASVAAFYPKPNQAGVGPDNRNNYVNLAPARNSYDAWVGKIDFNASSKSRISFKYGQTPWTDREGQLYGGTPAEPSTEYPATRVPRNWGAEWTYTLSPNLVFSLRGGLARYEGFGGNSFGPGYDPRKLGFPDSLVSQFTALQFPRFNMGDYAELGADHVTDYHTQDAYSIQPGFNWVKGRHVLNVGLEARRYNENQLYPGSASGNYTFSKQWTQQSPFQSDNVSGNDFASFLLGYPTSGRVDDNIDPSRRWHYFAAYVQDDFKVTPKLTINLGGRWDYEQPARERYDRMVRGFAFDAASPIAAQAGLPLKGGLIYAQKGQRAFESKYADFQPRIGVAYRIGDHWVLRGGYGLSYLGQSSWGDPTGFSRLTPLVASIDGGLTPVASLRDPFPSSVYPNGLLRPIGSAQGLATNLGQGVRAQYLNRSLPYSQQYSFGFEREIKSWLAEVTYSGNITRRLPVALDLNFIPTQTLNSRPVDQRPAYFTAPVSNPLAGLLPESPFNDATIPRQQLLVAYPQFSQVTITDVPIGRQRFDSLQTQLIRRFARGFAVQAAYTWSKTLERTHVLNAQDANLSDLTKTTLEKRIADWNIPQKFSLVGRWELPFGKGRPFGGNWNAVEDRVLGGWNVSYQWVMHSGLPFDFPNAAPLVAKSAALSNSQRDALAKQKGRTKFDPSYDVWFNTSIFPTEAQAPYTLRNFPTRFPDVRSKHLNITEISLQKDFRITEKFKFELRCDFQDAFNYPWFSDLQSNDVTDSLFGTLVPSEGNEQRVIVAVFKISF